MDKSNTLKSVLKTTSKDPAGIAAKVNNIEGKLRMPMRNVSFDKPVHASKVSIVEGCEGHDTPVGPTSVGASSFASVLSNSQGKKSVKISEMHNMEAVEGAKVVIPMEAVEEVSSRFQNTLYGFFIGKRLAFPLVENYVKNTWAKFGLKRVMLDDDFFLFQFETKEGMEKVMEGGPWLIRLVPLFLNVWSPNTTLVKDEIKHAPVWVKLRNVPIVAYSEIGLSLITTQIGRPIMLDTYTSNMCLRSWGRKEYARALVEYEWRPPRCSQCCIFDHTDANCPKAIKIVEKNTVADSDGFVEVPKKKAKSKQPRQVEGVRLSKPKPNFYYRCVDKSSSFQSDQNDKKDDTRFYESNEDDGNVWGEDESWKYDSSKINESDTDVDEELILEEQQCGPKKTVNTEGASTPVVEVPHD
ncbi:zinc knuckle CX2CX4HX4C containing protein [Tanacetum coccineum]